MELSNEFEVSVGIDEAWTILTDLERIAPCLPGAQLDEVEGDEYRGRVKVKVGPITAQYKGTARIVERDDAAHTALVEATGRDTRGQGNATATIRAELSATSDTITHVSLVTDLAVTGKVAQFGRGAMGDVSAKLLGQFVENLEATVLGAGDPTPPAELEAETETAVTGAEPEAVAPPSVEVEPIDLMATAGSPLLKRALPLVGVSVLAFIVVRFVRRRRRGKG
ncbi:MAG: SRPBCC family protein [Acidimicrobiales bacterium]|nr:SRPBCC family protein [Acidimicrobiales bacterium]MCB1250337.1 SRPBCC family protein [Acidimicrobiales bacterium]MCB1258784.1 SRPBCC family protein [Acidimicrobiales bacterium]